ncbi:MAG: DUF1614 domain-containing protein [Synechococcales cyanobacterium]
MIYLPVSWVLFLLLMGVLPFILFGIALDVVELAVAKLGFSPLVAFLLLVGVIVGSTINIPLYERVARVTLVPDFMEMWTGHFWGIPLRRIEQKTIVAVNVGGGVIPTGLALYEWTRADPVILLVVTVVVTTVSYFSAQVVPGIGIQMNALVAPLTAAFMALLVAGEMASSVAFAGGVLGVVIGADLLHLREIERMTSGVISIGGAGVFDGIALCGLMALLLT